MVRAPGIDLGGLGFNSLSGHITFNTGGVTSRGSAFLSREASELRDRGRGAPSASKGTKSSGMTSVSGWAMLGELGRLTTSAARAA